jgi:LmbE family N-acetylglucosaminyl deacetylase
MNIVAHEDDDLLFLSPDLIHDVQAGRCVRTVFVTAGAFPGDTDYGGQREAGSRAANALMAGVANSWTTTDAGISGHPMPLLTLAAKPTVSLVFMHLPQSPYGGADSDRDPNLRNLWSGTIASLPAYDGSSSYTKAQLVSALTSLMTAFQPDTVRTQDYVGTFDDGDHDDHHAAAYLARQVHLAYSSSHTFSGYMDYESKGEPQNVFGADLTTKTNVFNAYAAFDAACDCGGSDYAAWLKRQYVKATESQTVDTTAPTVAGVTPANSASNVSLGTSVSATFSEAVSSASVTSTSFVLRDPGGNAVSASVSANGSTVTLQPNAALAPSTAYTATLLAGSNGIKDLSGNPLASNYSWSFTTADGPSCPCSLWAPSATPQTLAQADTTAYELGVRFKSEVAGFITGIRFYKGSGNIGTHVGHLWTSAGTLLASATFTSETATGWQQVSFGTPVAISANTAYVVSYTDPVGRFSLTRPYFTSAYDSPPLHALADGDGGPNGLYKEGTGFPTAGSQASNYWVDVVFATSAADTTAPTVAVVTPASGASNVSLGTGVSATFSEPVSAASVTSASFVLRDASGNSVPATVTASGATATLQPSAALASSTTYTATLQGGASGIKDSSGNALKSDYTWSFTTLASDTTAPTVAVAFPADSGSYNAAGWDAGCSPSGLCGSASDAGSGVQRIEVSIRRASTNKYWTGTGYTSTTERWFVAGGTTTWSYALASTSFPGAGSYSVRVRATDNAGNVSSPTTTTFVYDNAKPSSTVTFPVAKASYTTASWNAGCATTGMCGTASDAVTGVQKVEISVRRGSASYWNGTSFSSSSEVFFPATGTTAWSFAFPAANFPAKANYTIRVRATDNAGNVESPSSRQISFAQ